MPLGVVRTQMLISHAYLSGFSPEHSLSLSLLYILFIHTVRLRVPLKEGATRDHSTFNWVPYPAGHGLFERFALQFRILPQHTAQ